MHDDNRCVPSIIFVIKSTTVEKHRRRTTDSRRDVFYARRGQTTTRHRRRRRHNADAATSSPPTPSSHILLRPENVGRPRTPCTCRCAGESRRVRSGTIAGDRRATKRIFFFARHALLLISRRGDAELGTRLLYRWTACRCHRLATRPTDFRSAEPIFCGRDGFSKSERISPARYHLVTNI